MEFANMQLPATKYFERRGQGYKVTGTRIGLSVIVHELRRGASPEALLEAFPAIGPIERVLA